MGAIACPVPRERHRAQGALLQNKVENPDGWIPRRIPCFLPWNRIAALNVPATALNAMDVYRFPARSTT